MRRPWIEATPMLVAAGYAAPPPPPATFTEAFHRRYGPLPAASILTFRRARMIATADAPPRFAILPHTDIRQAKPLVFESLRPMAQKIHALRESDGLELEDAPLLIEGQDAPLDGVSVWRAREGVRGAYIGWAYLDGGDKGVLERVLYELEPRSGASSQFAESWA